MNSVEKSIEEIEKMIQTLNACADSNEEALSNLRMAYMENAGYNRFFMFFIMKILYANT